MIKISKYLTNHISGHSIFTFKVNTVIVLNDNRTIISKTKIHHNCEKSSFISSEINRLFSIEFSEPPSSENDCLGFLSFMKTQNESHLPINLVKIKNQIVLFSRH